MADQNFWEDTKNSFLTIHESNANHYIEIAEKIESPIEKIMYLTLSYLKGLYGIFNIKVIRQAKIQKFRVDFLVKHNGKNIVIECDGHEWHEKTKQQASKDKKRDRELQKLGYIVLRYTGSDIYANSTGAIDDLVVILGQPEWSKGGASSG